MKKALLTLFVLICLLATIYSGYLLFTKEISAIVGSVLLAIGIILFIWSWSLVRQHRLHGRTVAIAFVIIAIFAGVTSAYAGYEPLAGAKEKLADILGGSEKDPEQKDEEIKIPQRDLYFIPPSGLFGDWRQGNLVTVKNWEGKDSKDIIFRTDKSPWVLNAGYKTTSQISVKFIVQVLKDIPSIPEAQLGFMMHTTRDGIEAVTVEEKGKFTIHVAASGCEWWVKIGVEP